MFDLLVYAIALVFVLWFIEQRPEAEPPIVMDAEAEALSALLSGVWNPQVLENQPSQIVERLRQRNEAEILEFLEIGTWLDAAEAPAYDLNLPPAQLRALAKVYGVPCAKRGRIGESTIAQLANVG